MSRRGMFILDPKQAYNQCANGQFTPMKTGV